MCCALCPGNNREHSPNFSLFGGTSSFNFSLLLDSQDMLEAFSDKVFREGQASPHLGTNASS